MGLGLHPTQHVVNVKWGGSVFIAINDDGNIFYLNLSGADSKWQDLGTLDFVGGDPDHFIPYPTGCAFGKVTNDEGGKQPVFVLIGGPGNTTSPGIIMASRNGKTWSRVFTFEEPGEGYEGSSIWAVVWNEDAQKFYAGGHKSGNFSDFESDIRWQSQTDLLFSSQDGFHWREEGRHEIRIDSSGGGPLPDWPKYPTGLLNKFCSSHVIDFNGNGISDGYYGYNKNDELIKPDKPFVMDYLFGSVGIPAPAGDSVEMRLLDAHGELQDSTSSTGFPTTCVATAGGKWMAAGGKVDPEGGSQPPHGGGKSQAAILVMNPDDPTAPYSWERLDPPGTNRIVAMCGGTLSADL